MTAIVFRDGRAWSSDGQFSWTTDDAFELMLGLEERRPDIVRTFEKHHAAHKELYPEGVEHLIALTFFRIDVLFVCPDCGRMHLTEDWRENLLRWLRAH